MAFQKYVTGPSIGAVLKLALYTYTYTGEPVPVTDPDDYLVLMSNRWVDVSSQTAAGQLSTDPSALAAVRGAALGATYPNAVVTVKSTADINAAVAAAVANQVYTVLQLPRGYWLESTPGVTATLDAMWTELDLNYGTMSCASWGSTTGAMLFFDGANMGVHDYTKFARLKRLLYNGMLVNDPAKYVGSDDGPDLLKFDTSNVPPSGPSTTSNRGWIEKVSFVGGRRNVVWGSASYFTKFSGCEFVRAYQCFDTTTTPKDFAEQNEFDECLYAENRVVWGPTAAGQIFNVKGGSIDYNLRIANMTNGPRVYFHDKVHVEWNYGTNAGETNEPFKMTGANGYIGGNCSMIYTGANDPAYASICASDNNNSQFNFELVSCVGLARKNNRKSLDVFHRNIGSVNAQVALKVWTPSQLAADVPGMTTVSESGGSYGMIRGGINSPGAGLKHIIGKSGTAVAVVERTATTNSVNRKPTSAEAGAVAQPMLEFSNSTPGTAAKYYICFPKYERGRKVAWAAFFNTFAITAGSVVIREWRNGPAAVFDGTSVTFAMPSDGANYHGTSITLTSANSVNADDWNRYDYRDTAGSAAGLMNVQVRHDMTFMDIVEIDMTNATGFLYSSFIGCAPIGAQA